MATTFFFVTTLVDDDDTALMHELNRFGDNGWRLVELRTRAAGGGVQIVLASECASFEQALVRVGAAARSLEEFCAALEALAPDGTCLARHSSAVLCFATEDGTLETAALDATDWPWPIRMAQRVQVAALGEGLDLLMQRLHGAGE